MGDLSLIEAGIVIAYCIVALLLSAIGREIFMGLMALRYGDDTPMKEQRITLNPFKHIDIFGTILIPFTLIIMGANFLFGYAKPMPINYENIQNKTGYKGCLYVALSGIFFNLFVGFCTIVVLKLIVRFGLVDEGGYVMQFFLILLWINVMLTAFNLLPIPPLNGALILAYLGLCFQSSFFARWYNNLEKYGMILIIIILLLPPTRDAMLWTMRAIFVFFLKL